MKGAPKPELMHPPLSTMIDQIEVSRREKNAESLRDLIHRGGEKTREPSKANDYDLER